MQILRRRSSRIPNPLAQIKRGKSVRRQRLQMAPRWVGQRRAIVQHMGFAVAVGRQYGDPAAQRVIVVRRFRHRHLHLVERVGGAQLEMRHQLAVHEHRGRLRHLGRVGGVGNAESDGAGAHLRGSGTAGQR